MRASQTSLFLAATVWWSFAAISVAQSDNPPPPPTSPELHAYSAENGRRIVISDTGNLIALESPIGFEHLGESNAWEGYVIDYQSANGPRRILYDVFSSQSQTIKQGERDLVPVAFYGPKSGRNFRFGRRVTAFVIVRTQDNLLWLVHQFSWLAGTGDVEVTTSLFPAFQSAVTLNSFKRVADLNPDVSGAYGAGKSFNRVQQSAGTIYVMDDINFCPFPFADDCPPPPILPPPEIFSSHIGRMSGSQGVSSLLVAKAGDIEPLINGKGARELAAKPLRGDHQEILVWDVNAPLDGGKVRSFTTRYEAN